jgi:hypothetical protein
MNYLLHNLGYDKPVNFREIVLRQYHGHCIWLRDKYFDRLDLYNYEAWLPNIQYEYSALQSEQKLLEKVQNELASLTEEKLQEMYSKEVSKIETLHNCHHSYHVDVAADISRCTDEYYKSLQKWLNIPSTPNWLTNELVDIYDTAMKDLDEHNEDDRKSVDRMHNTPVPTYEEFKSETIAQLEYNVKFQKDRIDSRKRNIKIVEQHIEEIKSLFAWLDEIEQED